jgi:hypothetical protein
VRFQPEHAGGRKRIYFRLPPPQPFIAAPVDLTVMRATKRHRKFVAHLAPKGTSLCEP